MDIQAGGTTFASFAVDKIDTKVKCTEPYADPVAKGSKLIALTVSAKTEPAGAVDDLDFYFNSAWLTFVDANGVTYNGDLGGSATYSCLPESKLLPGDLGPGSKAKGLVLLEVPSLDGMLVHSEYGLEMDLAKSIKKSD